MDNNNNNNISNDKSIVATLTKAIRDAILGHDQQSTAAATTPVPQPHLQPNQINSSITDLTPALPGIFDRLVLVRLDCARHLVAYPTNKLASAVRISWTTSPKGATQLEAELLPYFLNEDDAYDWHSAIHALCESVKLDYSTVKQAADNAFRSANGTGYRGIGGLTCTVPANAPVPAHKLVLGLFATYMSTVKRHIDNTAATAHSSDTTAVANLYDLPPRAAPAALTQPELEWIHVRSGHLALALYTSASLPLVCLPPTTAAFPALIAEPTATWYLDPTAIPRRARSMAAAMHAPRPKYIETLFVQALRGVSVPRPPVWLHRQAGRYLPEYRQVKGDLNFLDMTADPKIATEITLQPVWRYNVDCAIIFSDIMTIPQALGMELVMNPGPFFPHPIRTLEDIEKLAYQPQVLQHVYDALKLTRAQLESDKALVGFCGAPWTLMAYMIGKDLAKKWLHMHPEWAHLLLGKCTEVAIDYLCKQVDAGADVVQVFESNAVDLGPEDFYTFALPYLRKIAEGVKAKHPHVPMTVFPRGANFATRTISETTLYDAVSIDWAGIPAEQRVAAGPYVTLQGNLEPDVMYESPDNIRRKVRAMISAFGKHRYIVNLGHGTKLDMDPEHVRAFVEEAQSITIGSRNSPLAMAQAQIVHAALEKAQAHPAERKYDAEHAYAPQARHRFRISGVATKGDKILDVALAKIGDKGLFTKELEVALMAGEVSLVQHSLKDLETVMPSDLALGAVLEREDKRDALVSSRKTAFKSLADLPKGATLGTSSLRRRAQVAAARPDVNIVDVRGNLNTRIAKLLGAHESSNVKYDALVLAAAGLARLPNASDVLRDVHVAPIDPHVMVPAVSQGAIGVQVRALDWGTQRLVQLAEHTETRRACDHERTFLRDIQGGCQVPVAINVVKDVAAAGEQEEEKWKVSAHVWSVDGKQHLAVEAASGKEAAEELKKLGAEKIVEAARFG